MGRSSLQNSEVPGPGTFRDGVTRLHLVRWGVSLDPVEVPEAFPGGVWVAASPAVNVDASHFSVVSDGALASILQDLDSNYQKLLAEVGANAISPSSKELARTVGFGVLLGCIQPWYLPIYGGWVGISYWKRWKAGRNLRTKKEL